MNRIRRLAAGLPLWCVLAVLAVSAHAKGPLEGYGDFGPSSFSPQGEVVLVGWDTEEGQARLARSAHKADFFQLASNFQPQANPLYCGIASSVIVLNAMRLHRNAVPSQAATTSPTERRLTSLAASWWVVVGNLDRCNE